jgi:hypothetical protein
MSETPRYVWITKYALTAGIEKLPVKDIDGKMVTCIAPNYPNRVRYEHGLDWHPDEQSAKNHANGMVVRKITSLEKQIAKLKQLKF